MKVRDLKPITDGEPVYSPLYTESQEAYGAVNWWRLLGIVLTPVAWVIVFVVIWLMVRWMS